FQAEDGIRDGHVTGVQTCALPISVPEAPPTTRNQRATSCPAPISAKEPKVDGSRFRVSAFWWVSSFSVEGIATFPSSELLSKRRASTILPHLSRRASAFRYGDISVLGDYLQTKSEDVYFPNDASIQVK